MRPPLPIFDGFRPDHMKVAFTGRIEDDDDGLVSFPEGVPKLGEHIVLERVFCEVVEISHPMKDEEVTRVVKLRIVDVADLKSSLPTEPEDDGGFEGVGEADDDND